MFTPPPSPALVHTSSKSPVPQPPSPLSPAGAAKARAPVGRRTRWAAFSIPAILIIVALSTRYITHPSAFDILSFGVPQDNFQSASALHPRHLDVRQQSSGSNLTPTPTTSLAQTAQPLPTVPSAPPTLPTPFPQPYDATMGKNFSSPSCLNFFSNMTSTTSFRQCRPFSLLLQSSAAFLEAQTNLTLMNSIVWGTCNAPQAKEQCQSNMSWFAQEIQTQCKDDLADNNANARSALLALQSYSVMHDAACLVDPNTNSYCYLEAVRATNPTDLYYYMLPVGSPLPTTAQSSCSACTRSLMGLFVQELDSKGDENAGLKSTYNNAAQEAITDCGQSYATLSGNSAFRPSSSAAMAPVFLMLLVSIALLHV